MCLFVCLLSTRRGGGPGIFRCFCVCSFVCLVLCGVAVPGYFLGLSARWSNPAEYALLGEGHPRRGTMMIHLRGMARSSTDTRRGGGGARGDRAPRIPLIDGWQPFRVTNCGDSEGLQQTDAMCKAFLFDVGLRCPSSSAEGACPRCVSVTGVAKLGRCFCPWVESLSEKNSSGQPCYAATLAARREEWEQLSARVEAWETRERQHATLAGFWDELHYSVGEPCLAHPGVGDADFLRDHYQGGCLLSPPPHTQLHWHGTRIP